MWNETIVDREFRVKKQKQQQKKKLKKRNKKTENFCVVKNFKLPSSQYLLLLHIPKTHLLQCVFYTRFFLCNWIELKWNKHKLRVWIIKEWEESGV